MTFREKMGLTVHSQFDKSRFLRIMFVLSSDIRVKNRMPGSDLIVERLKLRSDLKPIL